MMRQVDKSRSVQHNFILLALWINLLKAAMRANACVINWSNKCFRSSASSCSA
ncbi:hypothetical protein ACFTAO_47185 [Paenibacillus rhizoplanae]